MTASDWNFADHDPQTATSVADLAFGPGSPLGRGDELSVGKAPVGWLVGSLAATALGGALALTLGGAPLWAVAAWALSGPVAIGLLAAFTAFDTRAQSSAVYAQRGWVKPLYVACLVLCGLAVCLSALRIASWVSRL